jgi:NAD(P)-dependent dehydrogenase (short-subunit alcohol dehydrogenase family)
MARELGAYNIRVNTVVPGWIMTKRQKDLWVTPEALQKQLERQCIPIPIEPKYVANMVAFLSSEDAKMCTAGNFMVEGGSI